MCLSSIERGRYCPPFFSLSHPYSNQILPAIVPLLPSLLVSRVQRDPFTPGSAPVSGKTDHGGRPGLGFSQGQRSDDKRATLDGTSVTAAESQLRSEIFKLMISDKGLRDEMNTAGIEYHQRTSFCQ